MLSKVISKDIESIVSEFKGDLKKLEGKTLLVTGANGMIPSYLVDVIAKYNQSSTNPCKLILYNKNETTETSRLSHLLEDENTKFFALDVGQPFQVQGNPDIIMHAASRANPLSFKQEPIDTIDANVNGTRVFLDYAKNRKIESFLFFSSSEVYGNPPQDQIPTGEDYFGNVNPLGDMACYAESKRFSETLCSSFSRQFNIPTKLLRIFHTFGPGLRNDGKTMANMFAKALNGEGIKLKDPGLAKRSYSYVSDTARGILKVMFNGLSGEAYNIGNDKNNVSVRDVAEQISGLFSLKDKVDYPMNYQNSGERIQDRAPIIQRLRDIGFNPEISFEEGLARLRDHYLEVGIH